MHGWMDHCSCETVVVLGNIIICCFSSSKKSIPQMHYVVSTITMLYQQTDGNMSVQWNPSITDNIGASKCVLLMD